MTGMEFYFTPKGEVMIIDNGMINTSNNLMMEVTR